MAIITLEEFLGLMNLRNAKRTEINTALDSINLEILNDKQVGTLWSRKGWDDNDVDEEKSSKYFLKLNDFIKMITELMKKGESVANYSAIMEYHNYLNDKSCGAGVIRHDLSSSLGILKGKIKHEDFYLDISGLSFKEDSKQKILLEEIPYPYSYEGNEKYKEGQSKLMAILLKS